MKNFFFLFYLALFTSCGTQLLYMNVKEPALLTLPQHVKRIGIIDRSLASKDSKLLNTIDQVLTLESASLDKEGAEACIADLKNELLKNTRFSSVIVLNIDMRSAGTGVFSMPIRWDSIGIICAKYQVDALYVLELFDTDTKVDYITHNITIKTPAGDVPGIEHEATILTQVKSSFRIYDNISKQIISEYTYNNNIEKKGRGINPVTAIKSITGRKEAVKKLAGNIGIEYAQRILPFWTNVSRDFFIKGNDNFKIAKRKAEAGNWDGAGEIWLKETSNTDSKIAGRACYNTAIINEINGDIDQAIIWAQKSYEDYGIKLALDYINVLQNRKNKLKKLENQ